MNSAPQPGPRQATAHLFGAAEVVPPCPEGCCCCRITAGLQGVVPTVRKVQVNIRGALGGSVRGAPRISPTSDDSALWRKS